MIRNLIGAIPNHSGPFVFNVVSLDVTIVQAQQGVIRKLINHIVELLAPLFLGVFVTRYPKPSYLFPRNREGYVDSSRYASCIVVKFKKGRCFKSIDLSIDIEGITEL